MRSELFPFLLVLAVLCGLVISMASAEAWRAGPHAREALRVVRSFSLIINLSLLLMLLLHLGELP
jgi:nitrate reductase gamma subunit